jgi:two-component system chemotaxis response regulator CheY
LQVPLRLIASGPTEAFLRALRDSLFLTDRRVRPEDLMIIEPSLPILVVDDYMTMVRIIRNLLTQIGFTNIDEASSGAEALEKIQQKSYGLIISDWNMEPMTGFQLLQKVREHKDLTEVPFIMVTAESKTENVIAARKAGVNHYIVKPFNATTLKAKIDSIFTTAAVA